MKPCWAVSAGSIKVKSPWLVPRNDKQPAIMSIDLLSKMSISMFIEVKI